MKLQKLSTCLLLLLLAMCMILTSCVTTPDPEDGTTESTTTEQKKEDPPTPSECKHTTTEVKNVIAATCAVEGYTGDTVCSDCGQIVSKGTTVATIAHTWNEGRVTKNPTCIAEGTTTKTCTACGGTTETAIPKVEHQDEFHDALDGTHTHTCSTCTKSDNEEHTPVDAAGTYHGATCEEAAYTEYVCKDCDGVYKVYSTTELATGHSFGSWSTTAATCIEEGLQIRSCECGESETVTLPVNTNAHQFELLNETHSTCTTQGVTEYVCECGASKEETAPLAAHSYGDSQPGNEPGWTYQECDGCGHQLTKFDASSLLTANLQADSLANISNEQALEVNMQEAAIQFPKEVVSQMKDAGTEVSVQANIVASDTKTDLLEKENSSLTEEQKARLENVPIYDFGVTANNQAIQFEEVVTVTLHYELQPGEDSEGIVIWYVNDVTGEVTEVPAVYNENDETVTFSVEHFSFYAVAYRETQEMKCRRGLHDPAVIETVQVSCEHIGYTLKECVCCHITTIDNVVERLPHDFGAPVQPTVTCEQGGYVESRCQNCNAVKQLEYVRALGHKLNGVATCTTDSVCERENCNKVVTPAFGHKWSEWETVVEPTDVNTGLRRRYCSACGEKDEQKLAATGNITALEFDSYQDLIESIIKGVLNFGSGTIAYETEQNGMKITTTITVEENNGSYEALVDVTMIEGTETENYKLAYRNGVIVYTDSSESYVMDLEDMFEANIGLSYDLFMDYAEQTFDYLDTYAEAYLGQVKTMISEYTKLYGESINSALAAVGSEYTVEDINKVLDALETVYAYMALKMGYETDLVMHENVQVPTKQDLHVLLSALTKATETEEGTLYTADATELMTAIDTVLTWFEERLESPLSDVIFDLIGAEITVSYPNVTDWTTLVAQIRDSFPGMMTVKQLTDKLITLVESSEKVTMDDIYYVADFVIFCMNSMQEEEALTPNALLHIFMTGEFEVEVGAQAILAQYADMTLDELAQGMMGAEELEQVYAMFLDQMIPSIIFGDIVVASQGSSNGDYEEDYDKGDYEEDYNDNGDYKEPVLTPVEPPKSNDESFVTDGKTVVTNGVTVKNGTISGDGIIVENDKTTEGGLIVKDDTANDFGDVVPLGPDQNEPEASGNDITVAKAIEMAREYFDAFSVTAEFSIELDKSGNLLGYMINQNVSMTQGENTAVIYMQKLTIDRDDSVTVTLPDELSSALDNKVTVSVDSEGNLVINGIQSTFKYDFYISGYDYFDLSEIVELDATMTAEMGFDVYMLKERYWNSTTTDYEHTYLYNKKTDKFYSFTVETKPASYSFSEKVALADLLAAPETFLPEDGAKRDGYFVNWDKETGERQEIDIYRTIVGYVYLENGEWMLIHSDYSYGYNTVNKDGEYEYYLYNVDESAPYMETVSSMVLSNTSDYQEYTDENGVTETVWRVYFRTDGFKQTVSVSVVFDQDDLFLIDVSRIPAEAIYTLGAEVTNLPEYEDLSTFGWSSDTKNTIPEGYELVALSVLAPTYFAEYDGKYFNLNYYNNPFVEGVNVSTYDTMTLKDGRTLYVKLVADTEWTYGYFHVKDNLYMPCVVSPSGEIHYRYSASDEMWISYDKMFDVEDYLTVNADGSYTIDVELVNALKALCTEDGDSVSIQLRGSSTVDEKDIYVQSMVLMYVVPERLDDPFAGMGGSSSGGKDDTEELPIDWYILYEDKPGYDGNYKFVLNNDGTISVVSKDGTKIYLKLQINKEVEVPSDAKGTYNKELSEEIGLDIYTFNKYNEYYNTFVFKDGKYYYYRYDYEYECLDCVVFDPTTDFIGDAWILEDLSYEFDGNVDGEDIPIYRGRVRLLNAFDDWNSYSLDLHFQIKDGKLYALVGAHYVDENGERVLKYEDVVLASEYMASLTVDVKGADPWQPREYYFGTKDTLVYLDMVQIYDGENYLGNFHVAYYLDASGNRQYITVGEVDHRSSLILGDEVTEKPNFLYSNTWTNTFVNGTFTFINGPVLEKGTINYVKIAGKYYVYDEEYFKRWYLLTEEEFFEKAAQESEPVFGVIDADGNWTYYELFEGEDKNGNLVFSEVLEGFDAEGWNSEWFNYTAEGYEAYIFSRYTTDHLKTEIMEDETIFYYVEEVFTSGGCDEDGNYFEYTYTEDSGYLKLGNGYYIQAFRTTNPETGVKTLYCTAERAYLYTTEEIYEYLGLNEYITDGETENEIVISEGILDVLEAYQIDTRFEVYVNGSHYGSFDYYDLEIQFNMANNK